MVDFGGILGMPIATGTAGLAGGVSQGDAGADSTVSEASFTGWFEVALSATPAAPATEPVPAAESVATGPAALPFLLDTDGAALAAAPSAATRARMFRIGTPEPGLPDAAGRESAAADEVSDAAVMGTVVALAPLPSQPVTHDAAPAVASEAGQRGRVLPDAAARALGNALPGPVRAEAGPAQPEEGEAGPPRDGDAAVAISRDAEPQHAGAERATAPNQVRATISRGPAPLGEAAGAPAPISLAQAGVEMAAEPAPGEGAGVSAREMANRHVRAVAPDAPQAPELPDAAAGRAAAAEHSSRNSGVEMPAPVTARTAVPLTGPALRQQAAGEPAPQREVARTVVQATGESTDIPVAVPMAGGEARDTRGESGSHPSREHDAPSRQAVPAPMTAGTPQLAPVLEALGTAPGKAAEPGLNQPTGAEVTSQIVQSLRTQVRGGIGEAVLRLNPDFLGEVTITVRVERGAVDATVKAESPAVREWLETQEPAVRQGLGEQGLSLARLRVEPDGQRSPAGEGQRGETPSQGRQSRQQPQPEERFELMV